MLPRAIQHEHRRLQRLEPGHLPALMTYAKVMELIGRGHIVAAQKRQSMIIILHEYILAACCSHLPRASYGAI